MRSFLAALVLIPAVAVAAVETPFLRGEGVEDQASAPPNSTNSVLLVSICRHLHNLVISRNQSGVLPPTKYARPAPMRMTTLEEIY